MKYLTLIRTIALLHQHQRPVRVVEHRGQRLEYLEVSRDDVEFANHICHEVLGRSLDELPPQTRALLVQLDMLVRAACDRLSVARTEYRFSRREVREATGLGNTQLKLHLGRLLEMEYLELHRERHGQRFAYSLTVGLEGVSEAILAADEASEPTMGTTEHVVEHEYDAKPVGGGRGAVGGEPRPVIVSDYGEMHGVVGAERERESDRLLAVARLADHLGSADLLQQGA